MTTWCRATRRCPMLKKIRRGMRRWISRESTRPPTSSIMMNTAKVSSNWCNKGHRCELQGLRILSLRLKSKQSALRPHRTKKAFCRLVGKLQVPPSAHCNASLNSRSSTCKPNRIRSDSNKPRQSPLELTTAGLSTTLPWPEATTSLLYRGISKTTKSGKL